jgi:hypothetical protein
MSDRSPVSTAGNPQNRSAAFLDALEEVRKGPKLTQFLTHTQPIVEIDKLIQ